MSRSEGRGEVATGRKVQTICSDTMSKKEKEKEWIWNVRRNMNVPAN